MGDVGALALGAALGTIAVIVRQEIVLLIMGGLFVVETLSVVIQVLSFKLTGKRVFRMAPIHHHFELKGWKENQVVVRFWIITMLLVLGGLSTLKLRWPMRFTVDQAARRNVAWSPRAPDYDRHVVVLARYLMRESCAISCARRDTCASPTRAPIRRSRRTYRCPS